MRELVTNRTPAGEITFDEGSHRRFTEASGDYNEIHVDPVAARRALSGGVVVHGIHVLLRALDRALSTEPAGIRALRVMFRKPVFPGDQVVVTKTIGDDSSMVVEVTMDDASLVRVDAKVSDVFATPHDPRVDAAARVEPSDLHIEDIAGMAGEVGVPDDGGVIADLFPNLVRAMGTAYAAHLMAISRLVGMVCPGRFSILTGVDLVTVDGGAGESIEWAVRRADTRVGAVRLDVDSGLLEGTVDAFVRPRPVDQPALRDLTGMVSPTEFTSRRALIVGGSRGLGALTAKLIAAGGGDLVISWHRGEAEAMALLSELAVAPGSARAIRLDARDPTNAIADLAAGGWLPTDIYYFASPPIFVRRTKSFEPRLLDEFIAFYVDGLVKLVTSLRDAGADELNLFYPSSVAVDEPIEELTEYSIAKAAGEQAARALGHNDDRLRVTVERLPRLPTDQTATILPVAANDPVPIMTRIVRELG